MTIHPITHCPWHEQEEKTLERHLEKNTAQVIDVYSLRHDPLNDVEVFGIHLDFLLQSPHYNSKGQIEYLRRDPIDKIKQDFEVLNIHTLKGRAIFVYQDPKTQLYVAISPIKKE